MVPRGGAVTANWWICSIQSANANSKYPIILTHLLSSASPAELDVDIFQDSNLFLPLCVSKTSFCELFELFSSL